VSRVGVPADECSAVPLVAVARTWLPLQPERALRVIAAGNRPARREQNSRYPAERH
jgi:hypothetical protein